MKIMVSTRWWGKFLMQAVRRGVVLSTSGIAWIRLVVERGRREMGMGRREADKNGEEGALVHLRWC
jgi:hypothetical protein